MKKETRYRKKGKEIETKIFKKGKKWNLKKNEKKKEVKHSWRKRNGLDTRFIIIIIVMIIIGRCIYSGNRGFRDGMGWPFYCLFFFWGGGGGWFAADKCVNSSHTFYLYIYNLNPNVVGKNWLYKLWG